MTNPIQVVQGAQYGSEAKGAVAAHLCQAERIDIAVRTGATNAGHTVYWQPPGVEVTVMQDRSPVHVPSGPPQRFVMQQLPAGWVNPDTQLVIGAGALVDPEILTREIEEIRTRTGEDIRHRLHVDPRCYIHWPQHARRSLKSDRHHLIGATGKGCSEALISRLQLRGVEDFTLGAHAERLGLDLPLSDTEEYLNRSWDEGAKIQLEGTQGQLLDLVLGPYPYTTHKQTGPAQWLLEAGLSPALPVEVVFVVRACPIRVAGNSGPLPRETTWPILADFINTRRSRFGLPPIVPASDIAAFEDAVREAASHFRVPDYSDGLDQHRWTAAHRQGFRAALSDLNAHALASLPDDCRARLGALFEMTTVTKKLRRIAWIHEGVLSASARQARPSRVVVTFMNYLFPERWGTADPVTDEERGFLRRVMGACRAPVVLVNRGPLPEHWVRV